MPTNLPPEAKNKWEEAEATKNPSEKLRLLEEFLSLVPKHKGTAKLCINVKKKIKDLKGEIEEKKKKRAARSGPKVFMEKEGAAQIVLIGLTKSGKSSLLAALTNARVEISPSPYTTRGPVPGIMNYRDIRFQLIEAPALMVGSADGRAWGLQTLGMARNADGLILVIDLSQNPVRQLSTIMMELEKARILLNIPKARVEIERKFMGAGLRIIVMGRLVDCTFKDVEELLKSYKVTDAFVKISGEATLEEIEDAIYESTVYKPAVVIANKVDLNGAGVNLELLKSSVRGRLPILAVSSPNRMGLRELGETLFNALNIMRVYTKEPNEREFSKNPFILKKGSTICDLARNIHSDFKDNFNFARVWSKRLRFSPQKVGALFILQDGDVVEMHLK